MSRAAAVGFLMFCGINGAAAQTPPATQPLTPPTHQLQQVTPGGQAPEADRQNHWFYDMLKKSDARHLTAKKPPRRPTPPPAEE